MDQMQIYTIFVLIFIIALSIERLWWTFIKNRGKEIGEVKAKWSLSLMTLSHMVIIIGSLIEYFLIERSIIFVITILGLCIFIFAFWLRRLCAKTLGKYQSLHVEIRETHQLIKNGPYKYMRHPWYLSIILECLSIPLILNTYYIFLYAILIHIPVILVRIHFEEKAMIEKLGNEYLQYQKDIWALLPLKKSIIRFK
jgi:protein-S-isoprenylcysteine O-methyltransferase Ste14